MDHDLTLMLVLVATLGVASQWLAWQRDVNDNAVRLLLVRPGGRLVFHSEKEPLEPQPGDTVLTFVPSG